MWMGKNLEYLLKKANESKNQDSFSQPLCTHIRLTTLQNGLEKIIWKEKGFSESI